MIRESIPERSPALPLVLAALLAAALLAPLVIVLERIGVPAMVLIGFSAGTALAATLVAGASGGTMRLPLFLTGGRAFGGFGLGVAAAALVQGAVPAGQAAPAAAALALTILVGVPAMLRAGAVSVPTFLAARYGGRSLRLFAAILVAGGAFVLGAAHLARSAAALMAVVPLGAGVALTLCTLLPMAILVPAGMRGLSRAVVVAGCLSVITADIILGLRLLPGSVGLPPLPGLAIGTPAGIAAVCAAILVLPVLGPLATAANGPAATREGALWAVVVVALSALAALAPSGPPSVFAGVAASVLSVLAPLATATALLGAAGVAVGYDLPGERDRLRVSTSRRFAQLRLAMAVVCLGAAITVARQAGPLAASWSGFAEAALVAGVLPPLLLTILRPSAGAGAGATAVLLGLAGAALAYDPRVWPGGSAPVSFALVGLVAGLAGGLLVSLVAPRARPVAARGDAAL